jgi:hypothetical protein
MPHEIAGITQCSICQKSFVGPAIIVGRDPGGREAAYMQKLTAHFMTEHPRENKDTEWKSIEFLGLLRMRSFRTTDAGLGRMIDNLRWQTLQQVLNAHISDANITTQTNNLAGDIVDLVVEAILKQSDENYGEGFQDPLEAAIAAKLLPHFHAIRDALEEPRKYPATVHPDNDPSRIVTV